MTDPFGSEPCNEAFGKALQFVGVAPGPCEELSALSVVGQELVGAQADRHRRLGQADALQSVVGDGADVLRVPGRAKESEAQTGLRAAVVLKDQFCLLDTAICPPQGGAQPA